MESSDVLNNEPGHKPLEIVSTQENIVLRQFTLEDAEDIFDLIDRNRPFLSQRGDVTAKNYPALESVRESIINPPNPNKLRFGIRTPDDRYVGSINLTPHETDAHKGIIGYYLGKEFTRNGYATRAVRALTKYVFDQDFYTALTAWVKLGNDESVHVLLRAGFVEIEPTEDKRNFVLDKH